jgi:hypothetical protein
MPIAGLRNDRRTRPWAAILTIACLPALCASEAPAGAFCGPPEIATPVVVARCPAFKEFSEAESIALGKAMAALRKSDPKSPILVALEDAFRLREGCRGYARAAPK